MQWQKSYRRPRNPFTKGRGGSAHPSARGSGAAAAPPAPAPEPTTNSNDGDRCRQNWSRSKTRDRQRGGENVDAPRLPTQQKRRQRF